MDEKQQKKFCNSIFILCHAVRVVWKYSFPDLPAVPVYVCFEGFIWRSVLLSGTMKKKSIFNVLYWFSSLLSFTKKKRKMNYFLYIENKINLKMLFLDSTAYAHNTQKNFIIILITFCVSVCGDVYSSWICLMVFQQRSEKRFSMEHNSIMITYVRRRDYSINNSLSQVSGWKALSSRCLPRWSGCQ